MFNFISHVPICNDNNHNLIPLREDLRIKYYIDKNDYTTIASEHKKNPCFVEKNFR